jgi:MFS family permease
MPDVTEKPLRSKGNAIINLMGTAGGISVLAVGLFIKTGEAHAKNYPIYVGVVCAIMIAALVVFLLTVKECAWAKEADARNRALEAEAQNEEETPAVVKHKLTKPEMISLCLILASVALWFTGYNAVTSKFSVYVEEVFTFRDAAGNVLADPKVSYDTALLVAQAAAIIAYIPVGLVSSRFGRKKTILAGVLMLSAAFGFASLINLNTPPIPMYLLFALAGIGWATINVNSFPMVVELATGSDVGKYTGFYYTASMSAQIITPILSGALVDLIGWGVFFPYAATFTTLSFITMLFVKHGDVKPQQKASLLEHLDTDD